MKKLLLLTLILLLTLAACSAAQTITVRTLPPATASPSSSQSVMPSVIPSVSPAVTETALLSDSPSPYPSASALPAPTPAAYKGTFIIADDGGAVYGGCSDGKWLTYNKAAALCKKKLTFYAYNLIKRLATVKSNGLSEDRDEAYAGSWTCDYPKGVSGSEYMLEIHDYFDKACECDFENQNALTMQMLYTVPPESFPTVTPVSDTSAYLPAIQEIVNKHLGKSAPKVKIRTAAQCDIDGDGELETIINADNCMNKIGDDDYSNIYCIACIIDNGVVHIVYDFYIGKKNPSGVEYAYIQNVIDLDGDGKCEIVVCYASFNEWDTYIYKYDGSTLTKVLTYDTGS